MSAAAFSNPWMRPANDVESTTVSSTEFPAVAPGTGAGGVVEVSNDTVLPAPWKV